MKYDDIFDYYQVGIYQDIDRIVVIGDIHGDLSAFQNVLIKAKVVNQKMEWIGGTTHVVQVGDILDRKIRETGTYSDEDSEFKIISYILQLQIDSYKAGGGFHPIIGNHELMNIMGIFDYVSYMGLQHFRTIGDRKNYFKIGGVFSTYVACGWNPIVKINGYLFCHGGISGRLSAKYTIGEINEVMRNTLYGNVRHLDTSYFKEMFINESSILWNRRFSSDEENPSIEHELSIVLRNYGAKHMVMGHTPQMEGIRIKYGGKAICVDTGMSEAFGKKANKMERIHYLDIRNGKISWGHPWRRSHAPL